MLRRWLMLIGRFWYVVHGRRLVSDQCARRRMWRYRWLMLLLLLLLVLCY